MNVEERLTVGHTGPELAAVNAALTPAGEAVGPLSALQEVPLLVEVRLGTVQLSFGELMRLRPGAVVTLEQEVGQPAEVLVGGKVIARGQMVLVGEELGVRLTELAGRGGEQP